MTAKQRDALNRIGAFYSTRIDSNIPSGVYQTSDVGLLLDLIEDLEAKFDCVKDDLKDLSVHLKSTNNDDAALAMVDSALEFLTYEE
jgi:hypothetical protein